MNRFLDRITPAQILYDKPDDKGGGKVTAQLPDEVLEGFRSLIEKEGGGKDAAATLFLENKSLRDDRRELREKLEAYEEISEEPEKLKENYKKYQELGDPEDLENKVEKGQKAIEKNAKYEREKKHSTVAEVLGWNPKVLNRLSDEDAEYEVKTRNNDDGKEEKYVVMKTEDGEKDLQEHAENEWEDVLPALQASDGSGEEEESKNEKKFSKQKSSGDSKSNEDDPVAARLQKNKKKRGIDTEDE